MGVRIKDQTTDNALQSGDFVIVDSQSEGTRKFDLGAELTDIRQDLQDLIDGGGSGSGLTVEIKEALLQVASKVAYIDAGGQGYYQDLYDALYPATPPASLSYITCVYTQSGAVYETDSLDSLKTNLVVTAHYSNGTSGVVTSYTLSGTLAVGTSTITVSYGGKTTTFNVTVTEAFPYVTDGLIHYFDAINNTENGHDGSSTTWEDLIGTDVLTMNDSTHATWESNALVLDGTAGQYLEGTDALESPADHTVEVVFKPDENQTSLVAVLLSRSGGQMGTINLFSDNTFNVKGPSSLTYTHNGSDLTSLNHVAGVYISTTSISAAYANGLVASTGNTTHSLQSNPNFTTIFIGQSSTTGTNMYPFKGRIYAIRIYNKQLTAQEIAQNYASDVRRFGLGA